MNKICSYFVWLFLLFYSRCNSQIFLNGDFELNSALSDQINLSNSSFNNTMLYTYGYGTIGNLDVITSSIYAGGAFSGDWFIALTGGGSDAVALELSSPLIPGSEYIISFYDKADTIGSPALIDIGVSSVNNNFGTLIYSASTVAIVGKWTERTFSFVAPFSAQFITIRQQGSYLLNWVQIDNFQFLCPYIGQSFHISSCPDSMIKIGNQSIVDTNYVSYSWHENGVLTNFTTPVIQFNSLQNEIWIREMTICNTVYADTFFISILNNCTQNEISLIIPNVFSPNDDGINDNFEFTVLYSQINTFGIFNRWGVKVYDIADELSTLNATLSTISWDGHTTSGEPCSEGVYYYIVEFTNAKQEKETYRGYINLFR